MKRTQTLTLLLGALTLLLFPNKRSMATHTMGADITYTCTGAGQYIVKLTLFRDCDGIVPLDPQVMEYSSSACGVSSSINLIGDPTAIDVTPLCPSLTSSCQGGTSSFGIEQYTFRGTLNLPPNSCDDWVLGWDNCCRNFAITTLTGPGNQSTYISANLNNTLSPCNNSPTFNNIPTPIVCINEPVIYNHGVTDPDGDDLRYSLVNCKQEPALDVIYTTGFSSAVPLSSSTGVTIDVLTGEIRFTPNVVQIGVICVLVEEYRGGVKIGETVRDMQFSVINCNNAPPVASGVNGDTVNYSINACLGGQVCFDIDIEDPDGDQVSASWNQGIPGGILNFIGNGGLSPSANFCWTPTTADTGSHFFTLTVEDDHCPLIGSATYAFTVNVLGSVYSLDAGPDTIICQGDSIQLSSSGTGVPTSYQWSPSSGLSNDTISNPMVNVANSTVYTLTTSYADGCSAQDIVQVSLDRGPSVSISPAQSFACPGNSVQLSVNAPNASSFVWNTGDILPNITVNSPVDTTLSVVASNANGCKDSASASITINSPTTNFCDIIYVSPSVARGSGSGTQVDPANLIDAINSASCANSIIKMNIGTYVIDEAITNIGGNLTIEGGFTSTLNWTKVSTAGATTIYRSNTNPVGPTHGKRISAFEITSASNFRFQDVTVEVEAAVDSGTSVYGFHLSSCSDYEFVRCQVIAGDAAPGLSGVNGADGDDGSDGDPGLDGSPDGEGDPGHGGAGGTGAGTGLAAGGAGGFDANGVNCCQAGEAGKDGNASTAFRSGGAGGGGGCGGEDINDGGDGGTGGGINSAAAIFGNPGLGGDGGRNGDDGTIGSDGFNGANGANGATGAAGVHLSGFWVPGTKGTDGGDGKGGEGGGGGGGGGGEDAPLGNIFDGAGDGGGGGGGGGEGATGGTGAYGGGSSYAVYLFNNGTNTSFVDCNLSAGTAGNGGTGGLGGTGGAGGRGGLGGDAGFGTNIGEGGDGGDGGNGGNGGNGGDGANGESMALYQNGGSAPVSSSISHNFALEPTVRMENISCTGVDLILSASGISTWSFGAGVTHLSGNPSSIARINVSTLGRHDVTFGSRTFRGFVNMISDNSTVPEASTSASFVAGYYRICAGDSIDLFALNPGAGSIINWDLDGGASPSTYSGLNFQSLNNIAFAVPDTYYIQLTYEEDCCGLTNTDTLTLIVEDQPNLSISGVTDFCAGTGGSVLTASGGTGYTWTPALGLSSTNTSSTLANPSSSTTYFVTTSNASGTCFDTRSIPVTVNDVQLAISSTDAGCLPNGSANVTASGGNGNYTYRWETSPVQTGNIATGLGPGTYKILVEDQGGCLDSSYVTINQSPGTLSTLISTTQPASCNGAGDGTATVTLSGGTGPYFYSWSPGIAGSGSTSNPVPAGTYSVTVTDLSDGCQSTATAIITEPAPLNVELLSLSTPDCDTYGEALVNASGGNGPFAYSWNTNPPQTGARGVGLGTGTYNVTVTDRDNCNTIFPVTVTGSQDPVSIDSVSVSDPITCGDSTGSAQAFVSGSNGGIAYTWNTVPPTNGALLNNVPAGPYELIATGLNGCADTAGITIGPLCPLVLQPLLLRASPENEIIHLRWDYEFSEDGSGFEVSKSEDGVGFEMLGWIAKEEGENNGFYFDDKEVILGERYFYRLKHIRPDGNFVYSNIEEVLLTAEGQNLLKHHRYNTDQGALELILNPHQFFGLDVALFNTAGQMLIKKYFDISDGIRNLYINLEGVSKGVYFLQLNNNEGFHQEIKIIIQN